ncbi:hypothetical protein LEN26_002741 [Aphanomyces euteiches]|nr:hypothetical protein LEN26_002741 [Aphanomyces euteiches]KAH9191844.1 hypothetical protein AeNC1_006175 [Aphanomyces euteiches]
MELQIQVRRARYFLFNSIALGGTPLDSESLELRVQCTINGELRSSGSGKKTAKRHGDGFIWRQDSGRISWYFTTKELRALKSKAPTLKLYVFAIGDEVYSLGWFFMDLRTPDTALRWVKLVNSKYGGELQVSSQLRKALSIPPTTPPPEPVVTTEETAQEDSDYLVLGDHPVGVYILSIVVEGAREMSAMVEKLLKKCSPLELSAILDKGFWLSYSMFDVVVQTDVFHNLDVATFDVIQDSFRLKSSVASISSMLRTMKVLPVFLCTVDRILCRIEVPMEDWLSSSSDDDFVPLKIDGPFPFIPSNETKGIPMGHILLSLELVQESLLPQHLPASSSTPEPTQLQTSPNYVSINYIVLRGGDSPRQMTLILGNHQEIVRFDTFHTLDSVESCSVKTCSLVSSDASLTLTDDSGRVWNAQIIPSTTVAKIHDSKGREVGECGFSWHKSLPSPVLKPQPPSIANCILRVHIASVKLASPTDAPLQVEYAHPFYAGPLFKTEEFHLAQSHQEIEVTGGRTTFERVSKAHLQTPLTLSVTSRGNVVAQAVWSFQYLAYATVQFECKTCGAIVHDWSTHTIHDGPTLYRPLSSCDVYLPLVDLTSNGKIGVLHALATFLQSEEILDEGIRPAPAEIPAELTSAEPEQIVEKPQPLEKPPQVSHQGLPKYSKWSCAATLDKERASFLADKRAWETSKKKQQLAMEQNEAKRMETLEAEWALREKERMQTVRDAQQEYLALEKKLRQTLHDLDERERALQKAEEALQHKLTIQKQEMDIVQRRTKSETQHALSLAEQQKQTSDFLCNQMEQRAIRAETQLKQLEQDLAALRLEQRKSPENVLRQEIIQHQATIATLEKQLRLLQVEKDKEVQVQKELSVQVDRLTQLLHQEKRKQEEQKVQDLEALRLKYIAREERYVLDGDREELKAIKKQLDVLRELQFSQGKELLRLQQEKQELLETGQYTEESFVIQELNRLIAAKKP